MNPLTTYPCWLLEADVFREQSSALQKELTRQRHAFQILHHDRLLRGAYSFDPSVSYIVRGSHPFLRQLQQHEPRLRLGWGTLVNFSCSAYYPHFRPWLLNGDARFLTVAEALQDTQAIFDAFADEEGRVFVRPDVTEKIFAGVCSDQENFATMLGPARWQPETRILVARPHFTAAEWRLVVADNRVLSGGIYRISGANCEGCILQDHVRQYAEAILQATPWRPDAVFMMDIIEIAEGLRLLELNSFSCSALYQLPLADVVKTLGERSATLLL